jgi:hypothetical protein
VLKEVGEVHLDRFLHLPGVATKFPALRSLTFSDFDYQSEERLAMLCAALPSVTEFTCIHTSSYPSMILHMMAGQLPVFVAGSQTGDPWPHLETLTTSLDIDDLKLVRDAMQRRQTIGHPLRVLRVPPTLFDYMDEEDDEHLEWLQANMTVELVSNVNERWPPGSDYDPDDTLF